MIETDATDVPGWTMLALSLDPVTPPPAVRERLMQQVSGPDRFAPFVQTLARAFDLSARQMRSLLTQATTADAWGEAILPGMRVIHFATGPAVIGRHAGFARVKRGFEFPTHRHLVQELTFVLEGMLVESDGSVHGPGDLLVREPTTSHAITVVEHSLLATLVGPVETAENSGNLI